MKTCRDVIGFLRDYLDGDLPDGQRAAFERHLDACPPCVAYLDSYRATITLAREACRDDESSLPAPPESLVHAILAARDRGEDG